ncbi:MAG TPA: pyridoxamine 5'-phosphate oxidase family protein [Candidatus Limnocylindrales bacterium]
MNWKDFESAAPMISAFAFEAFNDDHLAILGTLRANGWPRVSPCEVYFVDGELLLGMMPNSAKALDLRRDPRITVVNGQEQRTPKRGDVKLYGTAREITHEQQQLRDRFADAQEAVIDWRPTDPFHLFALDILTASYISFGEGKRYIRWSPERGEETLPHPEG